METQAMNPAQKYKGEELKPFTGRPGSMDAYKLPSLDNGERKAYRRPAPILTGNLADKKNHSN
jgi:hypothetical protein